MTETTREQFKHAIVIEEAHHILTGERHSFVGGQSVMELTFREIREFGESLIILDQHPSQISMPAMGNTYCTICFNLKHRTDVNAMAQAMLLEDNEKSVLGDVQIGQAVVRLQGRAVKPFMISVPEFEITKGAFTDADVTHHMSRLGLLSVRRQSLQEPVPFEPSATADKTVNAQTTGSRDIEMIFLRDVDKYPDSGIAERYKRLGLSVRHGQKLKTHLIGGGFISEQIQTTRIGKVRVVALTEKGRVMLVEGTNSRSHAA